MERFAPEQKMVDAVFFHNSVYVMESKTTSVLGSDHQRFTANEASS